MAMLSWMFRLLGQSWARHWLGHDMVWHGPCLIVGILIDENPCRFVAFTWVLLLCLGFWHFPIISSSAWHHGNSFLLGYWLTDCGGTSSVPKSQLHIPCRVTDEDTSTGDGVGPILFLHTLARSLASVPFQKPPSVLDRSPETCKRPSVSRAPLCQLPAAAALGYEQIMHSSCSAVPGSCTATGHSLNSEEQLRSSEGVSFTLGRHMEEL